jgi:hypothetical protein
MEPSMDHFISAAAVFRAWVDAFDPEACTADDVARVLASLLDRAPLNNRADASRPHAVILKPNPVWQGVQRKVATLPFNGYRTRLLPNDDATVDTQCALSYDVSDLHARLEFFEHSDNNADFGRYLDYVSWGYINLRIRAAVEALRARTFVCDPFERRSIKGRAVRFVGWRTDSRTHASEDPEDVRGAGTLCGGRLAFHKHTQQQWSCFACGECRCAVDGVEYEPSWPRVTLVVGDEPSGDRTGS